MARKKKKGTAEQAPWCYYCDRVFSDESTLIQHQKAKHFKVRPDFMGHLIVATIFPILSVNTDSTYRANVLV